MPNMRKIVPVLAKAIVGNVFCNYGSSKYHVSVDVLDLNFVPRCKAHANNDVLFYPIDTQVEVTDVCKRCLKYTEEVK